MKVVMVSQSDRIGGAAIAAHRLYQGLKRLGVDLTMLVQSKQTTDPDISGPESAFSKALALGRASIDRAILKPYRVKVPYHFHASWIPSRISAKIRQINPDVVHLHALTSGFVPIEEIRKIEQPIVWTLHDMWPFTGGCHCSLGCRRYQDKCGKCPMLSSDHELDLSRLVWVRKRWSWRNLNPTLVSANQWLAGEARSSSLFARSRVEHIVHGLDLSVFRPVPTDVARQALGLDNSRDIILFGAAGGTKNPLKGFAELGDALRVLQSRSNANTFCLLLFGRDGEISLPGVSCDFLNFGRVTDERALALLYAAADVTVVPSHQEVLPQTGTESMACGTPVVTFDANGVSELIDHRVTGYVARSIDADDLAMGLQWALDQSRDQRSDIRRKLRKYASENLDLVHQAQKYLDVYRSISLGGNDDLDH